MALASPLGVEEVSTTSGTGPYALGGSTPHSWRFQAKIPDGSVITYLATDYARSEYGKGRFQYPATLHRQTIINSSSGDAVINWPTSGQRIISLVTDRVASLPPGGSTCQALTKLSSIDFDTIWQSIIPPGGQCGQILVETDFPGCFAYQWQWRPYLISAVVEGETEFDQRIRIAVTEPIRFDPDFDGSFAYADTAATDGCTIKVNRIRPSGAVTQIGTILFGAGALIGTWATASHVRQLVHPGDMVEFLFAESPRWHCLILDEVTETSNASVRWISGDGRFGTGAASGPSFGVIWYLDDLSYTLIPDAFEDPVDEFQVVGISYNGSVYICTETTRERVGYFRDGVFSVLPHFTGADPDLPNDAAYDISGSGRVIVGSSGIAPGDPSHAVYWVTDGSDPVVLPQILTTSFSSGRAVSYDGNVIYGDDLTQLSPFNIWTAVKWIRTGPDDGDWDEIQLPWVHEASGFVPGSFVEDCSYDGSTAVGQGKDSDGLFHPVYWPNEMTVIRLPGVGGDTINEGDATGISDDLTRIVGWTSNNVAVLWENEVPLVLPLPGDVEYVGSNRTVAFGISGDGQRIIGWATVDDVGYNVVWKYY